MSWLALGTILGMYPPCYVLTCIGAKRAGLDKPAAE